MGAQNYTICPEVLDEILDKIRDIVEKSARYGPCIYRGEAKHYDKVCSGIYRAYAELAIGNPDESLIRETQKDIPRQAEKYLPEMKDTDPFDILAQLQHYGGATNLIDFTGDYLIALFFACDKFDEENGRVILLPDNEQDCKCLEIQEVSGITPRAASQKSYLVKSETGFIEVDSCKVVCIPGKLKEPMRKYLETYHGIDRKSIFNDIHGFIKYLNIYQPAYRELYEGQICQKNGEYEKAIHFYDAALAKKPDFLEAYFNKGRAYSEQDKDDEAISHYDRAIEINPVAAEVYYKRGKVYARKTDYDEAISDYEKAIRLDTPVTEVYCELGRVYHALQKFPEAISHFTEAIKRDPDNVDFYHERATTYEAKACFSLAIDDWNKVIELRPNEEDYYACRGRAHAAIEAWSEAEQDLEEAKKRGGARMVEKPQKVADFEKQHGVQLPDNIKALLTQLGILSN